MNDLDHLAELLDAWLAKAPRHGTDHGVRRRIGDGHGGRGDTRDALGAGGDAGLRIDVIADPAGRVD